MAQPPQKAPPPPPPLRTRADDHPPPAVRGGQVEARGEREPHYDDEHPRPIIGVRGTPIEDGERDPGTIAEEQRLRSAEMEKMGVEAWKDAHDDRRPEDRPGGGLKKQLETAKIRE